MQTAESSVADDQRRSVHHHRLPERSSTEIVHALFGPAVGSCWGDFSCNYNRQQGRLYAASKALLFYSNLFGFERRICMMLLDVEEISLYRTTSVRIAMVDGEEFIFKSLAERTFVVKLLEDLRRALSGPSTPPRVQRLDTSASGAAGTSTTVVVGEGDIAAQQGQSSVSSLNNTDETNGLLGNVVGQIVEEDATRVPGVGSIPPSGEPQLPPRSRNQSVSSSLGGGDQGDATTMMNSSLFGDLPPAISRETSNTPKRKPLGSIDTTEGAVSSAASENFFDEWTQLKEATEPSFKQTIIKELKLDCSISHFFESFLADEAPFSIAKYQEEQIGDTDVQTTPWSNNSSNNNDREMVRTLSFKHRLPRSLGIGPSFALTRREQRIRRYGDLGVCLESSTFVEGVPAAGAFHVDDRWLVESCLDGRTALTVQNETRFTKRTMLKRLIEKSTKAEINDWYEGYKEMVLGSFQSDLVRKDFDHRIVESSETEVPGKMTSFGFHHVAGVCILVLFIIVAEAILARHYVAVEVQMLRKEVTELAQAIEELVGKMQKCPNSSGNSL